MKVFIDVGAHVGETLEAVLDPKYGFDVIYCFEPVEHCCAQIRKLHDKRVRVIAAGLLDITTQRYIYDPGSVAASIHKDHQDVVAASKELCTFIEAAGFFKDHISSSDTVFMKLNCEGSEVDIVENLVSKNQFGKIKSCLIDFDVRKIPSQSARQMQILKLLQRHGFNNYCFPEEVQFGTGSHYGGIENWLRSRGAVERTPLRVIGSLIFNMQNILNGKHLGHYKFQIVKRLPKRVVSLYYRRMRPLLVQASDARETRA